MRNKISTPIIVSVVAFLMVCVGAVTILIIAGKPIDTLVALMASSFVPTMASIVLGKRLDSIGEVVAEAKNQADNNGGNLEEVKKAVNGRLDAKFRELAAMMPSEELMLLHRLLIDRLTETDPKS